MGLFTQILKPSHSLVLAFDRLTEAEGDELAQQIAAVRERYTFATVSTLAQGLGSVGFLRGRGLACLVFKNPRKGFWLWVLPQLLAEQIPFTLYIDPSCVGLNRLPANEELNAYAETYPQAFTETALQTLRRKAWQDPEGWDREIHTFRKELGPLPVENLDPGDFFVTWGKVNELPPATAELGWHLSQDWRSPEVQRGLHFFRTQVRRPVCTALLSGAFAAPPNDTQWLELGISSALTGRKGLVGKDTRALDLPLWELEHEKEIDDKN